MSYLAQQGVIKYNGYEFKGPRNSVQLEVIPVRDENDRYVTHSIYRFAVDAWITSDTLGVTGTGADTATHMTAIRGALQQDGGALTITGFGLGDVEVNVDRVIRDVAWGPKTQHLEMRSVGNGCVVLVWVIEVAIKTCALGSLSGVIGHLKEYVYNVRYSVQPNGCTTRTVEGHMEIVIAPTVVGGLTLDQTVDDYRDLITVPVPNGFYRSQPQEYVVTKGNTRLQFKVVDEQPESDNAYPAGVAEMDVNHTIRADLFGKNGTTMQVGEISGFIHMARPYPPSMAWEKALLIIQERLVHAVNSGSAPLIESFSITEEVFSRGISFSVRYLMLQGTINTLVTGSGLFTAVQSTNYPNYAQSMQIAWANRGVARMLHDASSDQLLNQCATNPQISIIDRLSPYFLSGSTGSLFLVCPPPEKSYLGYENVLDFYADDQPITISTMPTGPKTATQEATEFKDGYQLQAGSGANSQRRQRVQGTGDGEPEISVTIRGWACRVGPPPEIPDAAKLLGRLAEAVPYGSVQSVTQTGQYGDCPIWEATWSLSYKVHCTSIAVFVSKFNLALSNAIYNTASSAEPKNKSGGF